MCTNTWIANGCESDFLFPLYSSYPPIVHICCIEGVSGIACHSGAHSGAPQIPQQKGDIYILVDIVNQALYKPIPSTRLQLSSFAIEFSALTSSPLVNECWVSDESLLGKYTWSADARPRPQSIQAKTCNAITQTLASSCKVVNKLVEFTSQTRSHAYTVRLIRILSVAWSVLQSSRQACEIHVANSSACKMLSDYDSVCCATRRAKRPTFFGICL